MKLPDCIQRIVDDAEAAARVVAALDIAKEVRAHANGFGVICNCNFDLNLLLEYGMRIRVSEDKETGRAIVRAERDGDNDAA